MKAKYKNNSNFYSEHQQVYCMDNIFLAVTFRRDQFLNPPSYRIEICLTNAEARKMFFEYCNKLEQWNYECIYKEEST